MGSERKNTLVHLLEMDLGDASPGQKVAIEIAIALVRKASVADISAIASEIKNGPVFWEKQWR